jgi:hypothetical protein
MSTNPVQLDSGSFQPFGASASAVAQPAPVQGAASQPTTLDPSTFQPFAATQASTSTPASTDPRNSGLARVAGDLDIPGNLETGALHGLAETGAGLMGLSERLANPSGDPNNERPWFTATKNWLQQHSQNSGTDTATKVEQSLGKGAEDIAEFFLGDEALKGLSLSQKLAKATKLAQLAEESPTLARVFKVGISALRSGAVGTGESAVKSGGDPASTILGGGTAGLLTAGLGGLGETINILRNAGGQDALQNGFRAILSKVAADNGVAPADPSASLYNTVKTVADNVAAKSQAAFKVLDAATEGRFQRFETALDNISKQIAENEGIDDDKVTALERKQSDVRDAQEQAFEDARKKGVDPALIDQAKKDWKTKSALNDLSNRVLPTVKGTPPDIAGPGSTPEQMNPGMMFDRAVKLYHTGRLADALGPDNAKALVQHLDRAAQAADTAKRLWTTIKFAAPAALSGYGGLELLKDIF